MKTKPDIRTVNLHITETLHKRGRLTGVSWLEILELGVEAAEKKAWKK